MKVRKKYAQEIAPYMHNYDPERQIRDNAPRKLRIITTYTLKCKHGCPVTKSFAPLTCCPHCFCTFVETYSTIRRVEIEPKQAKKIAANSKNGKDPAGLILEPHMSAKESRVLDLLLSQPVTTRDDLIEKVWKKPVTKAAIYIVIGRLREKIQDGIVFDRKAGGYRLVKKAEPDVEK